MKIISGIPLPSISPIVTETGEVSVPKSIFDEKEIVPGDEIFLKTETV